MTENYKETIEYLESCRKYPERWDYKYGSVINDITYESAKKVLDILKDNENIIISANKNSDGIFSIGILNTDTFWKFYIEIPHLENDTYKYVYKYVMEELDEESDSFVNTLEDDNACFFDISLLLQKLLKPKKK